MAILTEYENKRILIEGVYGPNSDEPAFYENEVFEKIDTWGAEFTIIAGDWNLTLNPQIDTKNYVNDDNNERARSEVIRKINEYNLVDVWRTFNPDQKTFTWRRPGRNPKFGRIDFFLVSNSLLPFVQKAKIEPGCFSDYSVVILDIDFSKFMRGRGFWKFNNSLVYDPDYVAIVKNTIKRVTTQYANVDENPNFLMRLL